MRAVIVLRATKGSSKAVADDVERTDGIVFAYETFGRFDVAANAEVRDAVSLRTLVGRLKRIKGVTGAESLLQAEVA